MTKLASFFLPIVKVDKTPEGHRLVTGTVSTERVDLDGQIADYGWAKKEAQAWFEIANVREMHQRSAVGKGLDLQLDDAAKTISLTAKIVDPVAITKLDEGVYTGYSFGAKSVPGNPIKVVKDAIAPNGRINGGKWIEITLADRPANPDAVLTVAKIAGSEIEVASELGDFSDADVEKIQEPDTVKELTGDDAVHNDALASARAAIRSLISQEASEADEPNNAYQIQYLVDALNSVACFETSESFEGQYADMVSQMAQITDKDTRRGLYKSVSEALKKAADDHKAKVAEADVAKSVEPDAVKVGGTVLLDQFREMGEAQKAAFEAFIDERCKAVIPDLAKEAVSDIVKAAVPDEVKTVLPDEFKAQLPDLLKENKKVLEEELGETFAAKSVEADVEKLGRRAQPGGPAVTDKTGLRQVDKTHAVNDILEPGEVPLEALQEMAKYAELSKVDDIPTAQSARRMLTKLHVQYGVVPGQQ